MVCVHLYKVFFSCFLMQAFHLQACREGFVQASGTSISTWDTGVAMDLLLMIGAKSVQVPDGFVCIYLVDEEIISVV